jgi:hypothetical protein
LCIAPFPAVRYPADADSFQFAFEGFPRQETSTVDWRSKRLATRAENTQSERSELTGVGGWLLLLIVKLWISAAVRVLGGFSAGVSALGMTNSSGADVAAELALSAANVLAGILAGVAGYLLMRKSAKGPLFAKIFLVLDAGYYLLSLLSALGGAASAAGDSFPAWFKPTGYLLASVVWFAYLLRSRRVANTYRKSLAIHAENEFRSSSRAQNWEELTSGKKPAEESDEQKALKAQIGKDLSGWLRSMSTEPTERHKEHISFLREMGTPEDIEKISQGLLARVNSVCDHAYLVHIGECPTLPDTPDSQGSLSKELQKWAIASAGMKLTRCLDIRAAMEANGAFTEMMHDREYLLAIVGKNASDDGLGGKIEVAEYESHSGPEIAYMLIRQAGKDMFEAEMWARVAHCVGDRDFLQRFEKVGSTAAISSLQYWRGYVSRMNEGGNVLKPLGTGAL